MGFFAKLGELFRHKEREFTPEERRQLESVKKQIRDRCSYFRSLLSANKRALETMSELEERLTGERAFGSGYLKEIGARVATAVYQMIRELEKLTGKNWSELFDAFRSLSARMEELLAPSVAKKERGPLVLPLAETSLAQIHEVGGKMANLGEVASGAGLPVPAGFSITVSAYRLFLEENGLDAEIEKRIRATDMDNMDALFSLSAELQQLILHAPLPDVLRDAIEDEVELLVVGAVQPDVRLALRSSAVGEDAVGASFAGQYKSELNVLPEETCEIWKEIIASKYTVAALSYRYQRGIPDEIAPMSVGVLRMVRALAGGVAYSVNPVQKESIILNAVPGLPAAVVDGRTTPDSYFFSHTHELSLLGKQIVTKSLRMDSDLESVTGTKITPLSAEVGSLPSITDEQAKEVAKLTLALEEYYTTPQDVEWALEKNAKTGKEQVIILQSRPLQIEKEEEEELPELSEDREGLLIEGGIAVSRGIGIGQVYVARRDADMLTFPAGAILVVERASPRWAPLLPRAAGMISESGGMAGHLASVAREYKVPAIFGVEGAMSLLEGKGEISLDALRSRIFAGRKESLLQDGLKGQAPKLMAGSVLMQKLEALSELVVPLHLLDPESVAFAPENCRSLHDITRFCHEKAARFMFDGDASISNSAGKQLKAGAKLQYWVIDMDDGFSRDIVESFVDIKDIASLPMQSLWTGMTAIPWAGPPLSSASGLMSVVFESAMNPELEVTAPTTMAERNYFIISKDYMLLQARYGYHFCTVEALASAENLENFVSFQFKGGAASLQRRKLRAAMIAGLLEEHGFRADVRGDSMFAVAEGFSAAETLTRTILIGYLLIHTRQSDMIMEEKEQASFFRSKLSTDMNALTVKFG